MLFGRHINKYYLYYGLFIFVGLLALIAVDYYQLKIPEVYGSIIDGLEKGTLTVDYLKVLMIEMLTVIAIMVTGRFLWRVCFFGSACKMEARVRQEMFDHLKDLSQDYYSKNKVGSLMALFTNDLDTVQDCFGSGFLLLVDVVALGGMALYKMFCLNVFLSLLSLIPMVCILLAAIIVGKYQTKKWEKRQEAFSNLSDFTQESFSGIAVIKAFVKQSKELLHFKKINVENENINVEYVKISTILRITITFLISSVTCLILGYGGYLVYISNGVEEKFSVAKLIEFISYFTSTIWPLMAISELIDMTSRGKASLKRIDELLDYPIEIKDTPDAIAIDNVKGKIEYKDLTFRYPGADYDSLVNVSFTINAGENVGIVGKTGCGKTTLVDLLLRTYNIENEKIFVDDKDINSITIKSLRANVAYVPQDNFLFSDSIENNIAFAFPTVDSTKVVEAAKNACLDNDVSAFENKYATILGERGVTISGGQKQRTSIARALMKNASILILDDSVSAVDTKTEAQILENLKVCRKNMTTIFIAHRITTIENMDKIIFMDDGKVVAVGSHQELIANCRDYRNMVTLQKLEDEQGGNA